MSLKHGSVAAFPEWVRDTLSGLPALVPDADLAKLLTIDTRTLRRWRALGRLTSIHTAEGGSGRALTPRAEVGRLLVSLERAA